MYGSNPFTFISSSDIPVKSLGEHYKKFTTEGGNVSSKKNSENTELGLAVYENIMQLRAEWHTTLEDVSAQF